MISSPCQYIYIHFNTVLQILVLFCNVVELFWGFHFWAINAACFSCLVRTLSELQGQQIKEVSRGFLVSLVGGSSFRLRLFLYLHTRFVTLWIDMLMKLTTRWFDPDQNKHPHHEVVLRLNFVWTFFHLVNLELQLILGNFKSKSLKIFNIFFRHLSIWVKL